MRTPSLIGADPATNGLDRSFYQVGRSITLWKSCRVRSSVAQEGKGPIRCYGSEAIAHRELGGEPQKKNLFLDEPCSSILLRPLSPTTARNLDPRSRNPGDCAIISAGAERDRAPGHFPTLWYQHGEYRCGGPVFLYEAHLRSVCSTPHQNRCLMQNTQSQGTYLEAQHGYISSESTGIVLKC